jgi:hypothetical protein
MLSLPTQALHFIVFEKGKVVPVLSYLSIWESADIALPFLTSSIDGGEWSASCPGRFTPGERAPDTHWIRGWVDPRAGLNVVEKRKRDPARNRTPAASP